MMSTVQDCSVLCVGAGLPLFLHVLTPRLKALQLCIDSLRSSADAVYDVTIAYSSTLPRLSSAQQRLPAPSLGGLLFLQSSTTSIL